MHMEHNVSFDRIPYTSSKMSPPIAHDGIQVLHFTYWFPKSKIVYEPFTALRTQNHHNTDPATTRTRKVQTTRSFIPALLPCVRFVFFNVEFDANKILQSMMMMILSLLESLQRKMVSDNGTMHAH